MEKIWLNEYPAGVPHEIDLNEFSSLKDIIERGLKIDWFSYDNKVGCVAATDRNYIDKVIKKTYNRKVPISYKEVFNV